MKTLGTKREIKKDKNRKWILEPLKNYLWRLVVIQTHLNLKVSSRMQMGVDNMVDNMMSNYLKEVSIQEELKKVKIQNYLNFLVIVDMSSANVQDVLGLS